MIKRRKNKTKKQRDECREREKRNKGWVEGRKSRYGKKGKEEKLRRNVEGKNEKTE